MNTPLFLFIIVVLGLVLGSFLSVVIHRLHTGKGGIFFGNSSCPHCDKRLSPQEMIPVFSYLIQGGKCQKCHKKISWHYPVLELSTALTFLAIALYGFTPLPLYLFYGLVLIFIFFYDLLYMEIPDEVMLPSIFIAILATALPYGTPLFSDALLAAAALVGFFLLQIIISGGRWLGGGDLRIGAFLGLILGFKLMLVAVFASYILGSLISVGLLMSGKVTRKTMIAFGPFLVLGTMVALFYGNVLVEWYLNLLMV